MVSWMVTGVSEEPVEVSYGSNIFVRDADSSLMKVYIPEDYNFYFYYCYNLRCHQRDVLSSLIYKFSLRNVI